MIYTGTSEVGGIYVGDTEIAEVYRGTDLVYQNTKTVLETNGTSGTKTGTLAMRKGLYRITMAAGGGSWGWVLASYDSMLRYTGVLRSAGGGGGVYGTWEVLADSYVNYQVGAVDANSFIGPFTCTAGGAINSSYEDETKTAGTVSGLDHFLQYATAGGNAGEDMIGRCGDDQTYTMNCIGGASALKYTDPAGGKVFPVIDLPWGRGCSATFTLGATEKYYWERISNNDAVAGYLKVDRISN